MKGSSAALSVIMTVLKITVVGVIVLFVYQTAMKAYAFGYDIFVEEAMSTGTGTTVTITVTEEKNVMDIGEMLEEKGLIKDADLFYFQEKFSPHCEEMKPGVYELNTSMKPQEMIAVMAASSGEGETEGSEE